MTICYSIYAELKAWQSSIGALLGFGGLIVGALFNAHLNRKRDARLRDEEAKAIASALYGEIVIVRRYIARIANAVARKYEAHGFGHFSGEPFDQHFTERYAMPDLKLYPALASKVGLLPSRLALEIVKFYSQAEEVQTWLKRLQHDEGRPFSYGVNFVLDPAIDAVLNVGPALREIERMADISEPEEQPELKQALSAQAWENEQNEG